MKRNLLASILLLAVMAIGSCSKESSDSPLASSASQQQAQAAASEDESAAAVAYDFTGNYILHWSFTCGLYSTVGIYFNPDGTFVDGFAETGLWAARNNVILFKFDGRTDHWAGRALPRQHKVIGIEADFPQTGCFYLSKEPTLNKPAITKGNTKPPNQ